MSNPFLSDCTTCGAEPYPRTAAAFVSRHQSPDEHWIECIICGKHTEKFLSPGEAQRAWGEINKSHKHDQGKVRMALVPPKLIEAVGIIRTYGTNKYGDPEGWRKVEQWRYRDALMRHLVEYLKDPKSVDEESGHSHLWHMACNIAFLIEREEEEE